jgi:hypothetical protein
MLPFFVHVFFTFYIQNVLNVKFKVCKSVHHRTIQINHQPDATVFSVYYPDVCLQLNMFRAFSRPSSGAQWLQCSLWFYLRIMVTVVLCSWSGRPAAHNVFVCFVFIWEQTATCATYNINWLVFITETKSVYSAVRTGSLNIAFCASSLKG